MLFISCGKINTPNAESEKIFGTWRFVYSSGGLWGGGNASFDATDTYEYKENGTFSHRKDEQLIDCFEEVSEKYSHSEQLTVFIQDILAKHHLSNLYLLQFPLSKRLLIRVISHRSSVNLPP